MSNETEFDAQAFRQFEHDGWTEVASRYDDSFGPLTAQAAEALLDAARVTASDTVLDLACGSGRNSAAALRRGAAVTGIDLSQAMVAQAKMHCPPARFDVGDAEHLPYPPGSFDVVVCGFGVLHFPNAAAAVEEVYRVLRQGGRFACSVWCPAERSPYLALIRDAVETHGRHDVGVPAGPEPYRYGNAYQMEALLRAAGLQQVRSFETPVMVTMNDEREVLDALMEGGVRSRKLLQAQTPQARQAIAEFAAERAREFRTNGRIEIPRPALIGVGIKLG